LWRYADRLSIADFARLSELQNKLDPSDGKERRSLNPINWLFGIPYRIFERLADPSKRLPNGPENAAGALAAIVGGGTGAVPNRGAGAVERAANKAAPAGNQAFHYTFDKFVKSITKKGLREGSYRSGSAPESRRSQCDLAY
jgi:hypothetical protein